MGIFKKTTTEIRDLFVLEPKLYYDERGYFFESYNQMDFSLLGIETPFVQDNRSFSNKGVLRGIHFQKENPQAKLVSVLSGSVFDVAVDLRTRSETFGRFYSIVLSSENKKMLYIPRGFGHAFLVLSDYAEFYYKCDNFYHSDDQHGIIWNDNQLSIDWPIDINDVVISEKDSKLISFSEYIKGMEIELEKI